MSSFVRPVLDKENPNIGYGYNTKHKIGAGKKEIFSKKVPTSRMGLKTFAAKSKSRSFGDISNRMGRIPEPSKPLKPYIKLDATNEAKVESSVDDVEFIPDINDDIDEFIPDINDDFDDMSDIFPSDLVIPEIRIKKMLNFWELCAPVHRVTHEDEACSVYNDEHAFDLMEPLKYPPESCHLEPILDEEIFDLPAPDWS